jgi:hypothetical protein
LSVGLLPNKLQYSVSQNVFTDSLAGLCIVDVSVPVTRYVLKHWMFLTDIWFEALLLCRGSLEFGEYEARLSDHV